MRTRNHWLLSVICLAAVVGIGVSVKPAVANGYGNLYHDAHWMRYGYDRVWYHNRDYLGPSELTATEVDRKFSQGEKFIPTDDKVIGLPVYDTPRSLAFQKRNHVVSTLLFLKKPNGHFLVYSLSGGP